MSAAVKYCYNEYPSGVVCVSKDEIMATYWPWWKKTMDDLGRHEQISEDNCIADWCVAHWAWPVPKI